MKQCIKCGENKELTAFARMWKDGKITYRNVCKQCYNDQRRNREGKPRQNLDLVSKYLDACGYDQSNVDNFPVDKFKRLFHVEESFNINDLRKQATIKLESLGYCNPEHVSLSGRTLVIGDTFGKHTHTNTFNLIENILSAGIKQVVVIGHNTDDYNDVSNRLAKLSVPVYFLAIKNELRDIQAFCNQYSNKELHVVLDYIQVNGVLIRNQEYITPYMKTPIDALDSSLYPRKCIVNCTRHEYFTRPFSAVSMNGELREDTSFIASPGATAEPHVARVQYKMLLANGGSIKSAPVNKDSSIRYRKNDLDKDSWEKGCIIIDEPLNGSKEPIVDMIRFKQLGAKLACVLPYGTGYLVTSELGAKHKRIRPRALVLADLHVPYHSLTDMQIEFMRSMEPENFLILGDMLDMRPFNPHDTNAKIARTTDLKEALDAATDILSKLSYTAPVTLLWGNHESFANRFFNSYPQLESYIMGCITEQLSRYCELATKSANDIINFEGSLATHGSQKIYGGHGKAIDQLANYVGCPRFGEERPTLLVGHSHSPAIRFNTYVCGCSCSTNQGYNNANTTNWDTGMLAMYKVGDTVFICPMIGDYKKF